MGEKMYMADKETLDAVKADTTGILKALQDADGKFSNIKRYGVKINKLDSNPKTRVEYIYDAVGMNPMKMNYAESAFDMGDWGSVFFVKDNKPCMLNPDRTVAYYLNPNDYSLKADGTASDITDESTTLNAMSEFPHMYLCQYEVGNYEYIIVSDTQVDSSYYDDAFRRADGTAADKMYMPMYAGSYDGAKLRSLSGKVPMYNTNAQTEINRAAANGAEWSIISWSRRNLLESLLTIVGKSDDFQGTFGRGQDSGYVNDASQNYGHINTGTLDNKGQFFGFNDGTHQVKVFHTEKPWGERWDRILGYINDKGTIKVKMQPPYNLTGAGYDVAAEACKSEGWQKDHYMNRYGRFVKSVGASASTYRCCYYYINVSIVAVALVGGSSNSGAGCGAFVSLNNSASLAIWSVGASLSCESPSAA